MSARETILHLIKELGIKTYIEVGCWQGELLRQVKALGVKVIGIDPHKVEFNEFGDYKCRMSLNRQTQPYTQEELDKIASDLKEEFGDDYLKMTSKEAAGLDLKAEMVFIDAIHDYPHIKEDIELWKDKATIILCGDDYKTTFYGLQVGVDESLPDRTIEGVVWYILK